MAVRVQTDDFDVGAESRTLQADTVGGIALFVGTVRGLSSDNGVTAMTLEHYPGMTESELERIEAEARARCAGRRRLCDPAQRPDPTRTQRRLGKAGAAATGARSPFAC